ncbi:MAG: spore coat protein [Solirubrobacterales bacterium]
MFKDKDIATDCLNMCKHSAVDLTRVALECSNQQLRQTFVQMRNKAEQAQMEISQITSTKGWYVNSPAADANDITQVSQSFNSVATS